MTYDFKSLLTVEEMYEADRLTMSGEAGVPQVDGIDLMEAAGRAVAIGAEAMMEELALDGPIHVLCGPGNNGGDGFVAARRLLDEDFEVRLFLLGSIDKLTGDAAEMAEEWLDAIEPLDENSGVGADLVIDAIFGAGLARPLDGMVFDLVTAINEARTPVIAVDVPSGIDGNTGLVRGAAFQAHSTITFFRPKPGHLLMPGREHCGNIVVADIGIDDAVLEVIEPRVLYNSPALWLDDFPVPRLSGHKYSRGHTLVVSGGIRHTGASRLAALSALRVGSGLVTLGVPESAVMVAASHLTAVMLDSYKWEEGLGPCLADTRRNAIVIGPALGADDHARALVLHVLSSERACVLDADALTLFEGQVDNLTQNIKAPCVLTPHGGEFNRLFGIDDGSKIDRAKAAARSTGAVVVFKGPDTVIACPDGRVAINNNAPAWLATAGAGDVLAGLVGGLMAQGMDAFPAACAGVWIHGAAADSFGLGLIAEDLPGLIPAVIQSLTEQQTGETEIDS